MGLTINREVNKVKKIMVVSLLALSLLTIMGCANSNLTERENKGDDIIQDNGSNNDTQGSNILPGEDRIWWYQGFEGLEATKDFILELNNSNKNGDFNFGISTFEAPNLYKHFSTKFSGHIDNKASKKEDIFNSIYDQFWIEEMCNEDTADLPNYNRFNVYFYPFSSQGDTFDNEIIEYTFADYLGSSFEVAFTYNDSIIMKLELSVESKGLIDKDKMISELINNYKLIV